MGSPSYPVPDFFPPTNILMISDISDDQPFKNKSFLHQKYIEEGLSCSEIAEQIFSARTTVLKYLKIHNIPIREVGINQKRVRGLAFGQKIQGRITAKHQKELSAIEKMKELRDKGFSYWKIADILNAMKIPTKTRRGKWHARTIHAILVKKIQAISI
jgi:hypothetical protein